MITRLREIIAYYGLSDRAFAIKCGLKQATLDKQLKGLRAISLDTVSAILNTFGDISAEWIMRGKGNMIVSANNVDDTTFEKIERLVDTITTLQSALNEKSKTIQALEQEIFRLSKS